MPSPTDLSDAIFDALTERYGDDLEAEALIDADHNHLLSLSFANDDRYTIRIEPREDMPEERYFTDEHTGAHARITAGKLMIEEYRPHRGRGYTSYPLGMIQCVTRMALPGGHTAVAIGVAGEEDGPGLTFSEATTAADFEDVLRRAMDWSRRQSR